MRNTTHHRIGLVSLAVLTVGCLGVAAQRGQGPQGPPAMNPRLSGTYELESVRGDDPQRTAQAATRSLPPNMRDRAYQNLLARLEPPQALSIEIRGRTVTIASSRGPQSVFDADGRPQSERGPDGRMVTTRADLIGNQVRVSTSGGGRGTDFTVTFESLNNGSGLRVTRRLDDDNLARPVTTQSYYQRTAPQPRWDVYGSGQARGYGRGNDGRGNSGRSGSLGWSTIAVPEGTRLIASFDTPVSMRTSRSGEFFTMTVRAPAEFQGARISGVISRVNANRNNTTDLRVDFQTIELRGRSSDFDAYLNTVRLSDGSILRVNADGEVREVDRRGGQTVQNGAVGAAVGAIIGAIVDGGRGAAIGALVGGTGGVILSQGHEQLELTRGTEVTLTAVVPSRLGR